MPSKRFQKIKSTVDTKKTYGIDEAIELVKNTSKVKFDATIEMHFNLGIDPKKGEEQVRSTMVLPHTFGKAKTVAAFVESNKEDEAKNAGADLVGGEELIAEIAKTGKINFDVAVATPSMMPKLAKVAKILGPKGLMPNPKTDTVGTHIGKIVEELKKGKLAFKNDDTGNVHIPVGKVSFEKEKLVANIQAILDVIKKVKPASSKGTFIKKAVLSSTMGPGFKVQIGG